MDEQIQELMSALERKRISCTFAANRTEAAEKVLSMIPADSNVGIGGSVTIQELGIEETLKEKGCEVYWHWRVPKEEADAERRRALTADVYLCSTNAITEDGVLVNIDGTGNRVVSMVYGPKKAVIVTGKNKIVKDVDSALKRIKEVACPLNARRLNRATPCAKTGKCHDCKTEERMCNVTTIIERAPSSIEMHVLIVGEDMGF
ncbi:MAG: lactate utilization protein [Dethiobacter sp.]|nr:lactate utilization protein [Dethiobacter sp.]